MSTLLIKNARYIVSCDDTDRLYERSNLFIRDNAIAVSYTHLTLPTKA